MKLFLSMSVTLAPLLLGLAAWVLAFLVCFSKNRRRLLSLSWCACACALWFPLQAISRWAENGDIPAILDCVGAYFLCATILLAGNLLLSSLGIFLGRKRK